ncbi:MAG: CBS domain-containing protein [Dehalococcoidales bacterium]|nr:CBS domain-containing protein [Dehalococcoidales bacterium]
MYVRDYMTENVMTCKAETLVVDAQKLMHEHHIHRLPVMDGDKLVGIVTRTKLRDVAPSPATSLSIWELNYLLSKMKVKEVMEKNVITCTPDTTIEDSAIIAKSHGVGALPVVDNGKLVGIITLTDVMNIFIEVLGFEKPYTRLHIRRSYIGKPLGEITSTINAHGVEIMSMFSVTVPRTHEKDLIVRLKTNDPTQIVNDLRERGYTIEVSK